MPKTILIPLASGFEEAEFIGTIDVLRRAGINAISASLNSDLLVKGANNIEIKADICICKISENELDGIALPGGFEGMQNLKKDKRVLEIIRSLNASKKLIAAICAAPIVLNEAGVLGGDFTCYPGCEEGLNGSKKEAAVVANGHIITGAGPGVAILFGLELVRYLEGQKAYDELYNGLLIPLTK